VKSKSPPLSVRRSGFSLLELLTVLAITAVLAVMTIPSLSGLQRGNTVTGNLTVLSGLLEQARQTAVAKNTFVWVAFSDAPADAVDGGVAVALIGATGGVDSFGWNNASTSLSNYSDMELIAPVRVLKGVKLTGVSAISPNGLPPEPTANLAALESIDFQVPFGGNSRHFTKALQFSPTGEARVKTFRRTIEFGLVPATGDAANGAVLRLAGLTGKTSVYRAE